VNIFERFFKNPKTTIGGTAVGAMMLGIGAYVINEAHCDFSGVQWTVVLGMLFAGPQAIGGFATDNGATVSPVVKP
jgi:hypothetical protein